MGKAQYIIIAIILVLGSGISVTAEKSISNSSQASCFVQITIDKNALPLSFDDIDVLLMSPNVKGKAARDVLGVDSDNIYMSFKNLNDDPDAIGAFICELKVSLAHDMKPEANEFINAMTQNLRDYLQKPFDFYKQSLDSQIKNAQEQYDKALSSLDETVGNAMKIKTIPISENIEANERVYQLLDKKVDLSNLRPDMNVAEVLKEIKKAATGLNIQPNWRDLADFPDIQPTTIAGMEPMKNVRVGTAIDILLSNLGTVDCPLGYGVRDSVVLIADIYALPSDMENYIYKIPPLAEPKQDISRLIRSIQETIEPDSWYILNEAAEGTIEPIMDNQFSIMNTRDVHKKVMKFLENINYDIPEDAIFIEPLETLIIKKEKLTAKQCELEIDIAGLRSQLELLINQSNESNNKSKLSEIELELAGKEAKLQIVNIHLDRTEKQLQAAANTDPKIRKIQQAINAVDIAEKHLSELKEIQAYLQPLQVITIGI